MSLEEIEHVAELSRQNTASLKHSGYRESHNNLPPVWLEGPLLAEAFAHNISFEHRLETGNEKIPGS